MQAVTKALTVPGSVTLELGHPGACGGNIAALGVGGETFKGASGIVQGSIDGTSWDNLACIRRDTLAVEAEPTIEDGVSRLWLIDTTCLMHLRFELCEITEGEISITLGTETVNCSPFAVSVSSPLTAKAKKKKEPVVEPAHATHAHTTHKK